MELLGNKFWQTPNAHHATFNLHSNDRRWIETMPYHSNDINHSNASNDGGTVLFIKYKTIDWVSLIQPSILAELRSAIGEKGMPRLLKQLNHDCAEGIAAMAKSIKSNDDSAMRKGAHRLAGLFGQFGMVEAAALAEAVEAATGTEQRAILATAMLDRIGR